jgi:hypothetical protein
MDVPVSGGTGHGNVRLDVETFAERGGQFLFSRTAFVYGEAGRRLPVRKERGAPPSVFPRRSGTGKRSGGPPSWQGGRAFPPARIARGRVRDPM